MCASRQISVGYQITESEMDRAYGTHGKEEKGIQVCGGNSKRKDVPVHNLKAYGGLRYNSTHSQPWYYGKVSGQIHSPGALLSGKSAFCTC